MKKIVSIYLALTIAVCGLSLIPALIETDSNLSENSLINGMVMSLYALLTMPVELILIHLGYGVPDAICGVYGVVTIFYYGLLLSPILIWHWLRSAYPQLIWRSTAILFIFTVSIVLIHLFIIGNISVSDETYENAVELGQSIHK